MNEPRDLLARFLLSRCGVRGVLVKLGDAWQQIRGRADYPPQLAELLGQATAAAALFAGHVKVNGRLSVQLKGDGALRTLFADCNSAGQLRGIALWQPPLPDTLGMRDLGGGAVLAITIEQQRSSRGEPTRYQGLVALEGERLQHAFERYFDQSEQLPTRLLLAAGDAQAAGLLLQQLPGEAGDPDGWTRAQALFDTLGERELLATDSATLLRRLFHEEDLQMLSERGLAFGCSCSRERVGAMLLSLGHDEALAALDAARGNVEVTCEFCNATYRFDTVDLEQLFAGGGSAPASGAAH